MFSCRWVEEAALYESVQAVPTSLDCHHLVVAASAVKGETGWASSRCRESGESSARLTDNADCLYNIHFQCSACTTLEHYFYVVGFLALLLGCLTVNACFKVTK